MRFFLTIVTFIISVIGVHAQTLVYDENAELRNVGEFTAIEVSGTVSLHLSQGSVTGIAVSAGEEKYNQKIKTEVKDGVLMISVDGGVWNTFSLANRQLKAYVSVVDLNRLEITGASYVTINGALKTQNLKIDMYGASEIKGNLDAQQLNVSISGSSVAKLSGSAKNGVLEVSGASKIGSYGLAFDRLNITSSGASSVRVTVNEELTAEASGGSTIRYKGQVKNSRINSGSGASIKPSSMD